jgi:hypothetical protein
MSERVYDPTLSLEDAIDLHLAEQDTEIHAHQNEDLMRNSTHAFKSVVPETLITVPMAAAQEPAQFTANLLRLFAKQMLVAEVAPFALCISANYPLVKRESYANNIIRNLRTLDTMQGAYYDSSSHVPFGYYQQAYQPDTTIGEIRRDLLNASLIYMRKQYRSNPIPEYANVLIADVDTIHISRGYISSQQAEIKRGFSYTSASKRYATDFEHLPELSRAVAALNLRDRMNPLLSYDCHTMFSLRAVLAGGGFSAADSILETHEMRTRAQKAMGEHFVSPNYVKARGAIAVSPPRRPFEKFRNGKSMHEFWEKNQFGMQDAYREGVGGDYDITRKMGNFIVAECIGDLMIHGRNNMIKSAMAEHGYTNRPEVYRMVSTHIARTLHIANIVFDFKLHEVNLMDIMGLHQLAEST